MERFFASIRKEQVRRQRLRAHVQAKAAKFECIEVFYDRQRRHSGIGYQTPQQACEGMSAFDSARKGLKEAGVLAEGRDVGANIRDIDLGGCRFRGHRDEVFMRLEISNGEKSIQPRV